MAIPSNRIPFSPNRARLGTGKRLLVLATILAGLLVALAGAPVGSAAPGPPAPAPPPPAGQATVPPSITVSIGGTLRPGGQAVATVTPTGNSNGANFSYVWRVNGAVARSQGATHSLTDNLSLAGYHYGAIVSVAVTPSVGALTGPGASDIAVLLDHAPSATVTLTGPPLPPPAAPGPSAGPWRPSGQLTANVTATDPDAGDHVQLTYVWKVNGAVQQVTRETSALSDQFSIAGLRNGNVVSVTVTPDDGTMSGPAVTASGSIENLPPTATASLSATPRVGAQVTATAVGSDPEGAPVTFTYVWLVNGAQMQVDRNKGPHDGYGVDNHAKAGETITVRVVPNDGYVNGSVATASATLAAAVAPPPPPAPGPPAPPGSQAQGSQSSQSSQSSSSQSSASDAYDPSTDPYSMYDTTLDTGAQAWWNAGYTGKGIDVAVIDTGVAPVEGLNGTGKVVNGPDLSLESQDPNLRDIDTNGHGTFMAGLIAGRDPGLEAPYSAAPASIYRGMAPDARIVSLKVGDADGGVDVTQVIAAIDWVVQHAHDNGLNIRVISLSYGTNSTQSYLVDPLAYAAEQAWKAGIVVVAAAGNTGYQVGAGAPGVADPGYDPFLVSVGGYDTMGTTDPGDDRLGGYSASSSGCAPSGPGSAQVPLCKGPDLLAVGSHLQGLRNPGSYVDLENPDGRLGTRYFRGSGTSEATAITSGAIALILQKSPNMTPDQVKQFLIQGAKPIAGVDPDDQGAGENDLTHLQNQSPPAASAQKYAPSTGTGSIEASRGQDHLTADGVVLSGEEDIFGQPIDTSALAAAEASDSSWSGGTWNGNSWSGNSWSGNSWSGNSWSGNSWSGNSWSGNSWSGNSWSGNSWSGNSWSGNSWSGNSWSGNSWSGAAWASSAWS